MSKKKGPIEILCQEVNAIFAADMESTEVLVAFVATLVDEIDDMWQLEKRVAQLTGATASSETEKAIGGVKKVLTLQDRGELITASAKAHCTTYVPDEGPCDHYVDMLSSCLSAIRFGLEIPCRSRHAAEAANHVWSRKYGVTLFDKHSGAWRRQWTKTKFYEALCTYGPPS